MKIIAFIVAVSALSIVVIAFLIWNKGYLLSEMDWDADGKTSLSEMLDALNIGRRPIMKDGVQCQEFFRLKDGLPVRVDCGRREN